MSEKVAIVGSRKGVPAEVVERYIEGLPSGTTIISGECPQARSVDQVAKWYCIRHRDRFKYWPYAPDLKRYGSPAAFHLRNDQIAEACDRLVAFRAPGKSAGTDSVCLKTAILGKRVDIYDQDGNPIHLVPPVSV